MQVINYQVHNVLNISDLDMNMEGRHLFLVGGKNNQGKTSAIKALLMALCGRSGIDWPSPALKEGEKEGWVHVRLTGSEAFMEEKHIEVKLFFQRKRSGEVVEKFRILDSAGEEAPNPRKLLQTLYQAKGFDPLAFDRMKKKERRTVLMELVGLDLGSFKEERDSVFSRRTGINRDLKTAKARFEAMPHYADAPKERVNVGELIDAIEQAHEHNAKCEAADRKAIEATDMVKQYEGLVKDMEAQLKDAKANLKDAKATEKVLKTEADAMESADVGMFQAKVASAGELNEKLAANESREKESEEVDRLEALAHDLTDQLEEIDAEQDKKLEKAEWPIPGMSVDDEGVLVDGLPYESSCKSKRILTSTKVGMSLNPELRLLVCEDGSDLDLDTLEVLESELKESDFQMLVELVTRGDEDESRCAVVIEEGKEKSDGQGSKHKKEVSGDERKENKEGSEEAVAGATGKEATS